MTVSFRALFRLRTAAALIVCVAPGASTTTITCEYSSSQLDNAEAIIRVASAMHLDTHAAVLGVTAALGESDLDDLDYGDRAVNPDGTVADSVGLFQQQHWWGSLNQRLDPTASATAFFVHLEAVTGWDVMIPTAAIHAVQGNANPDYYTPYYEPATDLVNYLAAHSSNAVAATPVEPSAVPSSARVGADDQDSSALSFGDVNGSITDSYLSAIGIPYPAD